MASVGSNCRILGPEPVSTPCYFGTVTGGLYGTCENYCAVVATCTRDGWVDVRYQW